MPSTQLEAPMANGHDGHNHAPAVRKGKQKKSPDANEAERLLKARISQLEQDQAGEKDQEAEIEREVKRANREMLQQVSKLDDMAKIEFLQKRSSELLADMRRLDRENQKNKKRGDTLQKEKDMNRAELSKTVNLKEKLEKLCRELQRDNNKLKNENKTLQDAQKYNQASWDDKFSSLLGKLEGYQEEKDNPRKQVVDMEVDELFRTRFKSFIEQYELRELHFHSLMRTKELEVQLNMARYEKEKENTKAEATKARHLQSQVGSFGKTEGELRAQLNLYVDKFNQVEDTLKKSNDLFVQFRKDMEDSSRKNKKMEKEIETLKRKNEAMKGKIAALAEEREDWRKKTEAEVQKTEKLRSIITGMQQQGRKVPPGLEQAVQNGHAGNPADDDESDYSDDLEEEVSEFDDEDDDDTEEETQSPKASLRAPTEAPRPFGPERPPAMTNGH